MATEKRRPSREEEAMERAARRPSGKKGAKKAKKKRRRMVLFIIEIFVLLIMLVVLYGVLKTEKIGKITINEDDIVINEEVENNVTMKGYRNIALFGVDARNVVRLVKVHEQIPL